MIIDEYLNYLQEDDLYEFIVLPTLALAYKTYQRFWSNAAKNCNDKSFTKKSLCMVRYRIKALNMIKPELQKGLNQCSKSDNQKKCEEKIRKRIEKVNKRSEKLQSKMMSLQKKVNI